MDPLDTIADAAAAYAKDKREGVVSADHFSRLDIHTGDELENLGKVMADMEKSLTEHEAEITQITAEKERIGTELLMASKIQYSMMPHNFPPFPDRKEFDLYATMDPAKEVGGDFYDFFLIDEDHLCLVMADVSGKGIPAALFMMISKVILQSCAMLGRSAGEILMKMNEAICSNNKMEMFITVWIGILEISTGKMTAANAGHEYPVLMRAGEEFRIFKDKHGFVIGGMAGMNYKEYEIQPEPGRQAVCVHGRCAGSNGRREEYVRDGADAGRAEPGEGRYAGGGAEERAEGGGRLREGRGAVRRPDDALYGIQRKMNPAGRGRKRKMKRFAAVLMSLVMACVLFAGTATAETFTGILRSGIRTRRR